MMRRESEGKEEPEGWSNRLEILPIRDDTTSMASQPINRNSLCAPSHKLREKRNVVTCGWHCESPAETARQFPITRKLTRLAWGTQCRDLRGEIEQRIEG